MFKRKGGGGGSKAFWTMLKKLHFFYTMASLTKWGEDSNTVNISGVRINGLLFLFLRHGGHVGHVVHGNHGAPILVVTPKKDWDRGVIRLCLRGQAWRCRYKLNWEVGRGRSRSSWRDWFQVALSLATRWTNFLWGGWKGKGGRERERNHQFECWVVSARHIYLI